MKALIHHAHSLRLRPHVHTNYPALVFLVMVAGIVLAGTTWSAEAATHPAAQSGSIGVTGRMPAAPPKNAPTITSPRSGTAPASPIVVGGTCESGTIIQLTKNGIFAGASPCTDKGTFEITIDLFNGQNLLVARAYDALDQASPDSNTVVVGYSVQLPTGSPIDLTNFLGTTFVITTSPTYHGLEPGNQLDLPLQLIGGTPPFSLKINWGGDGEDLISRPNNLSFNAPHVFKRSGTYNVLIQGSDFYKRPAFTSTVVIVNGPAENLATATATGTGSTSTGISGKLFIVWPLYILALIAVISFWLGEQREKHLYRRYLGT